MYNQYGPPTYVNADQFKPGDLIGSGHGGHANGVVTVSEPVGDRNWHLEWTSCTDETWGEPSTWTGHRSTQDQRMEDLGTYIIEEEPV